MWQSTDRDTVIEPDSDDEAIDRGVGHLLRHHYDALEDRFVRESVGDCENRDCSHRFEPAGAGDDHPGYVCPHCGEDHASVSAAQLLEASMEAAANGHPGGSGPGPSRSRSWGAPKSGSGPIGVISPW